VAAQAAPAADDAMSFIELPTAAGLPRMESGRIVRVELAVSSLPAYGFEIVPDIRRSVVDADVVVGQDGMARAIRFVSMNPNTRRR
jgi:hypothetical protein